MIQGDVLTKQEMKQRNIRVIHGTRGGFELRAPTYESTIARVLTERGFLEEIDVEYGYTLMELRNAFLGALNPKSGAYVLLQTRIPGSSPKLYALRMYDDIMRDFRLSRQRIIESALYDHWRDMRNDDANIYRDTFRSLIDITDTVIEKIKCDIEKGVDLSLM